MRWLDGTVLVVFSVAFLPPGDDAGRRVVGSVVGVLLSARCRFSDGGGTPSADGWVFRRGSIGVCRMFERGGGGAGLPSGVVWRASGFVGRIATNWLSSPQLGVIFPGAVAKS